MEGRGCRSSRSRASPRRGGQRACVTFPGVFLITNDMSERTMHTMTGPSQFPTTQWTLVVAAADPHGKEARSALASLCQNYWYPLYAYLRRRGFSVDQAQDLTQEFFIRVLEGRYLD